ncbi:MAG: YicC/YloC family endoribonuclease [Elstera sp.]
MTEVSSPALATPAAPVSSMTGYARLAAVGCPTPNHTATWEIRAVNGRGLDIRFRLPHWLDRLEPALRERLKACQRGTITVSLDVRGTARETSLSINRPLIEEIVGLQKSLGPMVDQAPLRLTDLLGVRGVIESQAQAEASPSHEPDPAEDAALLDLFARTVEQFLTARRAEGTKLSDILHGQIAVIAETTAKARSAAEAQTHGVAERLHTRLAPLLGDTPPVPAERLAQEIALLAQKCDPSEEMDRLEAHCAAARSLLNEGGAIGRKLDFLAQEFNREANTLMSKAADLSVTQTGLALKTIIEQFREQVQNVE